MMKKKMDESEWENSPDKDVNGNDIEYKYTHFKHVKYKLRRNPNTGRTIKVISEV